MKLPLFFLGGLMSERASKSRNMSYYGCTDRQTDVQVLSTSFRYVAIQCNGILSTSRELE